MISPKVNYHDLATFGSLKVGGAIGANAQKLEESLGNAAPDTTRLFLARSRRDALKKFSITKIEEAIGAARAVPDKLAEVIGQQSVATLQSEAYRRAVIGSLPAVEGFPRLEERRLPFGARRGEPPPNTYLALESTGEPVRPRGTEFSLIGDGCMSPVRDQGERWTCVAFATCAVVEYAFCKTRHMKVDLSEQFQYWDTKCNDPDGYATLGTYPQISFSRVKTDGVCTEKTWPYDMYSDPPQNDPKGLASRPEAQKYCVDQSVQITNERDVSALKGYISSNYPVAVAIPVYDSWARNPAVHDSGNIGMPFPGEVSDCGHALVLVGFADDNEFPGGGYFIIRNSYGTSWGAHCPYGAGYGTIPYGYIAQENLSAFIVQLK